MSGSEYRCPFPPNSLRLASWTAFQCSPTLNLVISLRRHSGFLVSMHETIDQLESQCMMDNLIKESVLYQGLVLLQERPSASPRSRPVSSLNRRILGPWRVELYRYVKLASLDSRCVTIV